MKKETVRQCGPFGALRKCAGDWKTEESRSIFVRSLEWNSCSKQKTPGNQPPTALLPTTVKFSGSRSTLDRRHANIVHRSVVGRLASEVIGMVLIFDQTASPS